MYGQFIQRIRRSRGISQDQLAQTTGIGQPNLSAYELDRRVPTAKTLNVIVVGCGYQLCATNGREVIYCPLPAVGWFPDEGLPERVPDDPPDERSTLVMDATPVQRGEALVAAIELAQATR